MGSYILDLLQVGPKPLGSSIWAISIRGRELRTTLSASRRSKLFSLNGVSSVCPSSASSVQGDHPLRFTWLPVYGKVLDWANLKVTPFLGRRGSGPAVPLH